MDVRNITLLAALLITGGSPAPADERPFTADQVHRFETDVRPLLEANCLKCHSGQTPKGALDLTRREGFLRGGNSGPAVDIERPGESLLLMAINYEGYQMPPTGQLSPAQIETLTRWVQEGLAWPENLAAIPFQPPREPPQVNDESRRHWSFQPVRKPEIPHIAGRSDVHPIDAFLLEKLSAAGLQPNGRATPRELIRRATYDLTGLPPEPEAVAAFEADPSPAAWSELIESLLASPHYGEKWGRHWLDLVRYAETNSYERDGAKPFVWRYRDYVIQAFNNDKPYDRFLREQLAGDELPDKSPESIIATGYYRLGRWDDEPADPELAMYDDLDDIVTTTGQSMLGLTIHCARCHDHKIDPIPQRDYYSLLAFFRGIRRYGVRSEESVREASVTDIDLPLDPETRSAEIRRHQEALRETEAGLAELEALVLPGLSGVEKEEFQYEANRVRLMVSREGTVLTDRDVDRYKRLFEKREKLRARPPAGLAQALCVKEDVAGLQPTFVLLRGNPASRGEEVQPGFPSVLSSAKPELRPIDPEAATTGRRSVLAAWITDAANPLTARVMMNRIWQYHFGRGLVRTSSDFGFQGSPPTHPELLDWLAAVFVERNWSIKAMHRLIMTSEAYQMSSRGQTEGLKADAENNLFWRFDLRRLSAEEIRDSILWTNGSLNLDDLFGPSVFTDIPDAVKAGQSQPGAGWGKSPPRDAARRSIYIHVKRSLLDPLLESFDMADTDQACPVRFTTTQPAQALTLLNSEFIQQQAQLLSDFVSKRKPETLHDQVSLVLQRVTQRTPTAREIERGLELISHLQKERNLSLEEARTWFCLVALNLNEFVYLD